MNSSRTSDAEKLFVPTRPAVRLAEPLSQSLNAYALAAAAAGVTVLACALPAEGAPICKGLADQVFQTNSFPFSPAGQIIPPFNIAQTTFNYFHGTTGVSTWGWWNRGFFTPNTVGAKVLLGANNLPADVAYGAQIGPSGQFGKGRSYGLLFTYGKGNSSFVGGGTKLRHRGHMSFEQNSYVGFQFSQSDGVHYGWLRLSLSVLGGDVPQRGGPPPKHTSIHLLGYGYESAPNTAIAAGSCTAEASSSDSMPEVLPSDSAGASLGMLALGSEAISMWRKRLF
jgi:hypothetical protein